MPDLTDAHWPSAAVPRGGGPVSHHPTTIRYQGHTISVRKSPNGFRVASRPWPEVIGPSRKRKRDLASPPTIDTPEAKSCNCPPRVTQAGGAQSGRLRVGKADDGSPRM